MAQTRSERPSLVKYKHPDHPNHYVKDENHVPPTTKDEKGIEKPIEVEEERPMTVHEHRAWTQQLHHQQRMKTEAPYRLSQKVTEYTSRRAR
jgi:hypothetical protein